MIPNTEPKNWLYAVGSRFLGRGETFSSAVAPFYLDGLDLLETFVGADDFVEGGGGGGAFS